MKRIEIYNTRNTKRKCQNRGLERWKTMILTICLDARELIKHNKNTTKLLILKSIFMIQFLIVWQSHSWIVPAMLRGKAAFANIEGMALQSQLLIE